jgi:hypothetical protein
MICGSVGPGFTAISIVGHFVLSRSAVSGAIQKQLALAGVLRERSRTLDFRASLLKTSKLSQ